MLLLWDYWPLRRFSFADDLQPAARADGIVPKPLSSLLWDKVPLLELLPDQRGDRPCARNRRAGRLQLTIPLKVWLINVAASYVRFLGNALMADAAGAVLIPTSDGAVPMWQVDSPPSVPPRSSTVWVVGSRAAALTSCGMVLVPGHAGADDQFGAGRHTGDGRPLCLPAAHQRSLQVITLGPSPSGLAPKHGSTSVLRRSPRVDPGSRS